MNDTGALDGERLLYRAIVDDDRQSFRSFSGTRLRGRVTLFGYAA